MANLAVKNALPQRSQNSTQRTQSNRIDCRFNANWERDSALCAILRALCGKFIDYETSLFSVFLCEPCVPCGEIKEHFSPQRAQRRKDLTR